LTNYFTRVVYMRSWYFFGMHTHAFIEEPGYRQSKGIPGWKIYRWKKNKKTFSTQNDERC